MTPEQKNAFTAVKKLNKELELKYKDFSSIPLISITFAGLYMFIGLSTTATNIDMPAFTIYNSTNDDRIYYESLNKYESYYKYIKRKFNLIKEEIYSIEL